MKISRRELLEGLGAAPAILRGQVRPARPKLAAVCTPYFKYSHSQHIVDRFLGMNHSPLMGALSIDIRASRNDIPSIRALRKAAMSSKSTMCFLLLAILVLSGCGEKPRSESPKEVSPPAAKPPEAKETGGEEVALIQTKEGTIVLRFFEKDAPKTVAEFKRLAGKNFYNGTTFHRVISSRLIQGGDPLSRDRDPYNDGTGNSGIFLPAEFNKRPFRPGTVGLARGPSPDSGSCQFFICLARNPQWDGDYTAFAEVVEGLDVARKISESQTNPKHRIAQMKERPIREQLIESIRIERRKL